MISIKSFSSQLPTAGSTKTELPVKKKLPSNNRTRLISCDKKNFPPCFSSRVNKLFQHEEDWSCEWRILNYPWNIIYLELSFSFMPKRAGGRVKTFQICSQKHIRLFLCELWNCWIGGEVDEEEKFSFILRSTLHFARNRFLVVDNTLALQENFGFENLRWKHKRWER